MANASILKTYEFSGFGNFSSCFGWDNGLSCSLGANTTLAKANSDDNSWYCQLPETPKRGIFSHENTYGGSRNVYGFVIANSRRDARKLLNELENSYEIVEYEQ